jgi:hypothetical protein
VARDFSEMAIVFALALPHHRVLLLGNWLFSRYGGYALHPFLKHVEMPLVVQENASHLQ